MILTPYEYKWSRLWIARTANAAKLYKMSHDFRLSLSLTVRVHNSKTEGFRTFKFVVKLFPLARETDTPFSEKGQRYRTTLTIDQLKFRMDADSASPVL